MDMAVSPAPAAHLRGTILLMSPLVCRERCSYGHPAPHPLAIPNNGSFLLAWAQASSHTHLAKDT